MRRAAAAGTQLTVSEGRQELYKANSNVGGAGVLIIIVMWIQPVGSNGDVLEDWEEVEDENVSSWL